MFEWLRDKRTRRIIALGIALGLQGVIVAATMSDTTRVLNLGLYDWLMRERAPEAVDDRIILVTLDEESRELLGKKIGQFTRSYFAAAIENLANDGAQLIAMDFDFSKPTFQDPGQDENLANAIYNSSYVVLAKFVSGNGITVKPLPMFAEGALALANINLMPDEDGVVRKAPLAEVILGENGEERYLTMAAELAWWMRAPEMTGVPVHEIQPSAIEFELDTDGNAAAVIVDPLRIPVEGDLAFVNIDYTASSSSYERVSFGRVVRGEFPAGTFAGRTVLVGNTHPTGHDFYSTPMRSKEESRMHEGLEIAERSANTMAGVEVHANLLDAILHDRFIETAWGTRQLIFVLLTGLVSILAFWLFQFSTVASVFLLVILGGLIVGLPSWVFVNQGVFLPFADSLIVLAVHFVGGNVFERVMEGLDKAEITQTFGRYVSPQVVDQILDDPEVAQLGGEKVNMTVMFSDIRGFTTISESMDPEELVHFLNRYLTRVTKVIFDREGVVDKYMGDAVMAFWGAPIKIPNHAKLACTAALEMEQSLLEFQQLPENQGLPRIEVGVGMNTGVMTVGNMGSDMRFDYTVMGDAVNLGSRLEGINKQYKTRCIISESTLSELDNEFIVRELDRVKVKGKNEPVVIFELVDFARNKEKHMQRLDAFARGLAAYRSQQWSDAESIFKENLQQFPEDGPSEIYLDRISALRDSDLPADWDGVFTMTTK